MKKSIKLVSLMLAVLIAASLPVVTHAAYDTAQIYGHNVVYEAKKYTNPLKAYGALKVVKYGAVPDFYTAGSVIHACNSNGTSIAHSTGVTISYVSHGFTLTANAPVDSGTFSYALGYYGFMGVSWNYTSTGVLNITSGSFD